MASSKAHRGKGLTTIAAAAMLLAACGGGAAKPSGTTPPMTVGQATVPAASPEANGMPNGSAARPAGPNLLAKGWDAHLGITVSPMTPAKGKPILNPKPGDLWFFSNASTAWGATNTKNAVWVIDAKTKKTVAEVAPPDGEGNSSHGIIVSGDGRFIYLGELGKDNHIDVLDGRTLEVVQTITTLGRPHHQKLWHDPTSGKDLIIGEDFNWSFTGSGFYVLDPSQDNAVVGGLSNGDFEGNPYVSAAAPDGKFIIVTVPAPTPNMRDKMEGYVAKVDPKTWKVVGMTPMIDPLYPIVSVDGKYVYVTSGGLARLFKIDTATMKIEQEVQTGPGPWGEAISYDGTKLYTADKGEGPGYNQQGRTSTVIDLQTMGVVDVVPIGLTTDHALLSPDGKEIWYTSNAEHNIRVLDTATDKIKEVIQDPADGDLHGGAWVQYKDDGKGGVIGEEVADYAGLHGSALAAQQQYLSEPAVTIALGSGGFAQKSIDVPAGQTVRLTIKNIAGTSGGKLTFESADLGIKPMTLTAGQSQELRWTAPAQRTELKAKTGKAPNDTLTISVKQPQAKASASAAAGGGPQVVTIHSSNINFGIDKVTVKAGQPVRFVFTNGDDEKHNLVGVGEGLGLLSPDVGAGQTVTYDWTAPDKPGNFKVVCAYHPQMVFSLVIQ